MPYANNKGADQPAHPRSLIGALVVRCVDSIIPLLAIAEISRPWLVSVAEQADLGLTWSQTPKTCFLMAWPSCHQYLVTGGPRLGGLSLPYANNRGADRPTHPCGLIGAFVGKVKTSLLHQ